jgi:hypothetical protein
MSVPIIIAKNDSGSEQKFLGSVMQTGTQSQISDLYSPYMISTSSELTSLIASTDIVLNDGTTDLSPTEALSLAGNPRIISCCVFGAKSDSLGKFLIANGKSSDADDSSKDKTRQPIPHNGTITTLAYKTKEANSNTRMKIHVNGVVEESVTLTSINSDDGGVESVSITVSEGDYVEIEYDANQKPGECTMYLLMELS